MKVGVDVGPLVMGADPVEVAATAARFSYLKHKLRPRSIYAR